MIIMKINNDIALSTADAIVNASNGIGFMGGKSGLDYRKKVLQKAYIMSATEQLNRLCT